MMKKILLLLFCIGFPFSFLCGQKRGLEINYIAHDHYTEDLLDKIDEIYNSPSDNKQTYLYLASGDEPMLLKCNGNNETEYEEFRYAIASQIKHNVWPEVDIKRILELFKEDDFINEEGIPTYDYFTLNFYITPSFWTYKYNETLIGRLLWNLEIDKYFPNVNVAIYHPENDDLSYDENRLCGPKLIFRDNQVMMFTY